MADNMFENLDDNNDSNDNNSGNYLEQYVGEGKKYKDVEELAKAYANADQFIPKLQDELGSMRQLMTTQFEQLYSRNADDDKSHDDDQNDRDDDNKPNRQAPPNGDVDENDLNAKIKRAIEETRTEENLKQNAEYAQSILTEKFGGVAEAQAAIVKRAKELGVSPQFLADAAFTSPNALFKLMEIEPDKRSTNTPDARSDVNVRMLERTGVGPKPGTYEYYRNLQRTDPKKYWRASTQNEMMQAALKAGPDFFKS